MPDIFVAVYPDSGAQRIIEVTFQWPESQTKLTEKSVALLVLARQLLGADPPAGESYTPQELAAILQANTSAMDPGGASDPYSALSGADANQLAHTLALELLFQLAKTDVTLVTGMDGRGIPAGSLWTPARATGTCCSRRTGRSCIPIWS